uniref:Spermatogenesis-defective protein 39 homolog n=1 Tax=Callorhinchus milii TaxID=7868 RepID=A0A4W3K7A3_CALMI
MNRNKNDEEDYWNSTKCKAFIFDDDDEFTQLKESKRAVNNLRRIVDDDEDDEDDDDVEKVTWSGERVGSIAWSVKENSLSTRASEIRDEGFARSQSSHAQSAVTKPLSTYSLSSFFKGRNREPPPGFYGSSRPGSFLSLSDSVIGSGSTNIAPDLRKSKFDYKDSVIDWNALETVRRMQKAKPYSLEKFRSLKDKLQLVDEAVRTHDGNVITAVLIFLNKTLSKEVLFPELGLRQGALNHFICYLKEMGREKVLMELLRALGRTEEAALLHYKQHLNITDQIKKTDFVKSCIGFSFAPDDATHVEDHYTLLDRQLIIEANDKRIEAAGQMDIFKRYPRKASILNMPLITTLYYACFYHYGESEVRYANISPQVNNIHFILLKNWLGYTKKKAPIGFHRVVDILHKNNAPVKILQEYIALVDNPELKLNLATKYKCHDIVIESYKDLKDRQQLLMYRKKVDRGSEEERKIDIILNNSQIRWKN